MQTKEHLQKNRASVTDVYSIYTNFFRCMKFHMHQRFFQHPMAIEWRLILLPGKLKQTLREPAQETMGFSSRFQLRVYRQFSQALIQHSPCADLSLLQRQHSSLFHFADSENKRQNPRRTPQETACGGGWKTSSFSAWLHLNQECTSSFICPESLRIPNASTEQYFFVEVFKYRENKQILK